MIDMFLKIPEIPGDSVNAAHPNEIPVLAYSLGFTTSSAGTRTSRPVAQNLSVTIYYSKVSPPLFLANPSIFCSTNQPTASTQRGSPGCATF